MVRAWAVGFVILLTVDVMVVIATIIEVYPRVLWLLLQISPFVAAFISAYLSPRKKVLVGTSMAIPAAILGVVVTFLYQLFGKAVDFPGLKGGLILLEVSIIYGLILCVLGGTLGYLITRKKAMTTERSEGQKEQ